MGAGLLEQAIGEYGESRWVCTPELIEISCPRLMGEGDVLKSADFIN